MKRKIRNNVGRKIIIQLLDASTTDFLIVKHTCGRNKIKYKKSRKNSLNKKSAFVHFMFRLDDEMWVRVYDDEIIIINKGNKL